MRRHGSRGARVCAAAGGVRVEGVAGDWVREAGVGPADDRRALLVVPKVVPI